MQETIAIRILEKENNRRGDLFGRLMADLFVALGYEYPRLNVHKSGRELDIVANHRLEPRWAIGECKATTNTIGGKELNTFVGRLDVEHNDKRPLTGYFISLAGFTEAAIEQEKQRQTKIVTLTGSQVVKELVNGRIIIAKDRATELAGRCCAGHADLVLDLQADLLAHERGWIWAIYYTQGKARTHCVLVHSDGTLLARALTDEVVVADQDCDGVLTKLVCLNPAPPAGFDADPHVAEALAAYCQYLTNECGFIQLDGLPADSDVGSRRLRIENLFVPLHLDVMARDGNEQKKMERQPVGSVISSHPRLALLAAPGGGKSTLIKRLAVAYADPSRREQTGDGLPPRDWLPLFFRCRELRGLAHGSFAELLDALSQHEPVRLHAAVFRAYVDRALLSGRVLLLVDGLDEISDPSDRAAFVCTIRTALQAYPGVAFVVTSREAGFRHVAAHLSPVCTHATISPFNPDDIRRLTVAWHREVVGDTDKVRTDAEQLASTIVRNDRIKRLAVNPLLLTTLLLVKRWVGALPTRRAVLYGKAVELLLMTWNVEGHAPIPDDEALPQLCFVASGMMLAGLQKISRPLLAAMLQDAREALPTELGYVKGSVDEFIHRVEDRSSLLMMTGHDVENGQLVEFFEFRHLTFQEFLTARAMVEGWHPGRKENDTLVSVLEPHFEEERWREVIPLAAVLGGKATEALIRRLTDKIAELELGNRQEIRRMINKTTFSTLGSCLADEAQARPETIRAALDALVRLSDYYGENTFVPMLVRGRYGLDFQATSVSQFFTTQSPANDLRGVIALESVVWWQAIEEDTVAAYSAAAEGFLTMLEQSERLASCKGAVGITRFCFKLSRLRETTNIESFVKLLRKARVKLQQMIFAEQPQEQFVACQAIGTMGECRVLTEPLEPEAYSQIFHLWRRASSGSVRQAAGWCMILQPVLPREVTRYESSVPSSKMKNLLGEYEQLDFWQEKPLALVCAWYAHALSNGEITKRARKLMQEVPQTANESSRRAVRELLKHLGEDVE